MIQAILIGDRDPQYINHINTDASLYHAAAALNMDIEVNWLSTDEVTEQALQPADLVWCAPGGPYKSIEGALSGIRYARENNIPLIGTCGGFQHAIIEYARNVIGIPDAHHAEYDTSSQQLVITKLECSVYGQTLEVRVKPGTLAHRCYANTVAIEQYHCRYGLNPAYRTLLENNGLKISGLDNNKEVRIVELPDNDFFLATLFLPQSHSTKEKPHPVIVRLVEAAYVYNKNKQTS